MSDDTPGSGAHVPVVALARVHDGAPRGLPLPAPLAAFYFRRREQLLYLVVGGWNTVFGYGVWALLQYLLGDHLHYLVVVVLSWPIAVLNAYLVLPLHRVPQPGPDPQRASALLPRLPR